METNTQRILADIGETRASLASHWGELEGQFRSRFEEAKNTVIGAKACIDETINSVVKEYPLTAMAATTIAGFALGKWAITRKPLFIFRDELRLLRAMLLSTAIRKIGETAERSFPQLASDMKPIFESAEAKIRG